MAPKPRPAEERFWEKVSKGADCWEWNGERGNGGRPDNPGYGRIRLGGKTAPRELAHRFAYRQLVGPIPDGMQIHHLCENKGCVNPAHMELRSLKEHMQKHQPWTKVKDPWGWKRRKQQDNELEATC